MYLKINYLPTYTFIQTYICTYSEGIQILSRIQSYDFRVYNYNASAVHVK
jgi:hypothetical protein